MSEIDSDDDDDGVLVTGSSDPLSLRVSFRQPVPGHEDVVALCVRCVNTTNLTLSDFEIHIRPLGAVKCVDSSNDLKLRLLQGGESASGGLASFGVFKAEKRFQLQRFAHAAFSFQVVFHEVDATDASGDGSGDGPQVVPIRLAPSERYVLPFPALCRSLKQQLATAAFFQRAWQWCVSCCLSVCLAVWLVVESVDGDARTRSRPSDSALVWTPAPRRRARSQSSRR